MTRAWLLALVVWVPAFAAAEPTPIDDAFRRLYNFDFTGTHAIMDRYIAAHPQEPMPYAVRASAYLFYELDRLGVLESEFFADDKRIIAKKKLQPDPAVRAKLLKALGDVETRADAILAAHPDDRNALLAICIAQGVTSDYMALVEKHQIQSLMPAKRSNAYAQRLLRLDPTYYDAYLSAGVSEYLVGSIPFFVRWFVHFENVKGSKESAVDHLLLVAQKGNYLRPFAKILLGIIYLRAEKPAEAKKLLVELTREYPENPLIRNELAKVSARLGVAAN